MKTRIYFPAILLCGMVLSGCATTHTGQHGAVLGGLLGATAGAIIGNQSGDAGEGALIGAALGGIAGAAIGDSQEKNRYNGPYTETEEIVYRPAPVVYEVRTVRTVQRPVVVSEPVRRAGHYETRLVRSASGETYEERVWVYD